MSNKININELNAEQLMVAHENKKEVCCPDCGANVRFYTVPSGTGDVFKWACNCPNN